MRPTRRTRPWQPSLARASLVWLIAVFSTGTAMAQRCDGIEVAIGIGENSCLKPGASGPFRDCANCPAMAVIPAGSFTMGSPPDESERASEREDQVSATIAKPFAIGAFAVTRAAFVAATNHRPDSGCYFWTGTTWEERSDRSWQSPGFAPGRSPPGDLCRLEGCLGLRDLAVAKDGQDLSHPL